MNLSELVPNPHPDYSLPTNDFCYSQHDLFDEYNKAISACQQVHDEKFALKPNEQLAIIEKESELPEVSDCGHVVGIFNEQFRNGAKHMRQRMTNKGYTHKVVRIIE